jgi:hypothetical protein
LSPKCSKKGSAVHVLGQLFLHFRLFRYPITVTYIGRGIEFYSKTASLFYTEKAQKKGKRKKEKEISMKEKREKRLKCSRQVKETRRKRKKNKVFQTFCRLHHNFRHCQFRPPAGVVTKENVFNQEVGSRIANDREKERGREGFRN